MKSLEARIIPSREHIWKGEAAQASEGWYPFWFALRVLNYGTLHRTKKQIGTKRRH